MNKELSINTFLKLSEGIHNCEVSRPELKKKILKLRNDIMDHLEDSKNYKLGNFHFLYNRIQEVRKYF